MFFCQSENENKSKLFCYLPLEQPSPVAYVHVNADWSLHRENRLRIYDFCMRQANLNKQTAERCIDWNLCIFGTIIVPLMIRLLEHVKNEQINYTSRTGDGLAGFVDKYINLFPHNENQKDLDGYFKSMYNLFYQRMLQLELLPIVRTISGRLEWFKPRQVYFFKRFNDHLRTELTLLNSEVYESLKQSIYRMIDYLNLVLCHQKKVYNWFKSFAKADLIILKSSEIIEKLKVICYFNISLINLEL